MDTDYLFWSAQAGLDRNVRRYLRRGGEPNAVQARTDMTALHIAALNGHSDVVATLLDHGADPAVADAGGRTALDLAMNAGRDDVVGVLNRRR